MKKNGFSFTLFFVIMFLSFGAFAGGSGGGTDIDNTVVVAPIIAPVVAPVQISTQIIENKPVNINTNRSESNAKADADAFSASSSSAHVNNNNDVDVKSTNINLNEGNKNNVKVENENDIKQSINFAPVTISQREFVNPATVSFPGLTTMGVDPGLSVNYQPYGEILMFKKTYTESELRQMAENHGFQRSPFIRTHKFGPPGEFKIGVERTVTFIISTDEFPVKAKYRQVLSFNGACESKKGYSEELFGRAGLEIIAAGGNYGYLLNQGYKRHSKNRSLGIFFGGTGAQMSDNGDKSQSVTPSIAGSAGSSQLPEFPWLRVTGLYVQ